MSTVPCVKPSGRTVLSEVVKRFSFLAKWASYKENKPYVYAQRPVRHSALDECRAIDHPGEIAADTARFETWPT